MSKGFLAMRPMRKPNFNRYVALNLIQGRTGVRFCDAESSSARRKRYLCIGLAIGHCEP